MEGIDSLCQMFSELIEMNECLLNSQKIYD